VANEYADWRELKDMRNISGTSQDGALQRAIKRASRSIDRRCARRFYRDGEVSTRVFAPYGRTITGRAGETLLVPDIASEAGLLFSIAGIQAPPATLSYVYFSDTERAITGVTRSSWYGGRLEITAEFGWPAVPDNIEQATLLLANRRYMRKDSPEGVSGWNQEGAVQVSRYDPDIEDLVQPYVLEGFGA